MDSRSVWIGAPRTSLVDDFSRPAITVSPERTLGTELALRIVGSLLMGAADDAICHDDRLGTVLTDEGKDLFSDGWVSSNIAIVREPTFERVGFGVLRGNDADRYLASELIAWTVERDRGHGVATKSSTGLLLERGTRLTLELLRHDNLASSSRRPRINPQLRRERLPPALRRLKSTPNCTTYPYAPGRGGRCSGL